MERELKRRTKHVANHNAAAIDEENDEDNMNEDERDHITNEKLLNRLYRAADIEHEAAVRFEGVDEGDENVIDN